MYAGKLIFKKNIKKEKIIDSNKIFKEKHLLFGYLRLARRIEIIKC